MNKTDRMDSDLKTRRWILKAVLEGWPVRDVAKILGTSPQVIKTITRRWGTWVRGKYGRERYLLWGFSQERSGLTEVDIYLSTAEQLPGAPGYPNCYGWLAR